MQHFINKIRFLVGIIFWLGMDVPLIQHFPSSTPLHTYWGFRCTQCWSNNVGLSSKCSKVTCLVKGYNQAISPTTLLSRLSFFSAYIDTASHLVDFGTVPLHPIRNSDWHSQRQYYSKIFWIGSFLFSCWPSILTTLKSVE